MKRIRVVLIALLLVPGTAEARLRSDLASAGRVETAAGIAPPQPGITPEPAATLELRPAVGGRLSTETWSFTTTYQQRLLLRRPNLADTFRPTLLHQCATSLQLQMTPRLSLQSTARVSAGTVDYAMASAVVSANTSAPQGQTLVLQRTPVAPRISTASADVGLTYQATQRAVVNGSVTAYRQEPIGTPAIIGTTTTLTGRTRYGYAWTARTTQGISLSVSRNTVRPLLFALAERPLREIVYYAVTAQTDLAHQFSLRTNGTLSAGISRYSSALAQTRWFPSVQAGLVHTAGREGRRLTLSTTTGISAFVEPLTGRLRSNVLVSGALTKQLNTNWTMQGNASSSLPASRRPITPGMGEANASASFSVSRRLGYDGAIEFGTRYMTSMTHPNDPAFEVIYQQVWVYAALSLWLDTNPAQTGQWAFQ